MTEIYSWQRTLWQRLSQKQQLRGHALLLQGRQGIGKYDFARHWAKSRLCVSPTATQEACGACLSCGWFEQNAHPNFYPVVPEALSIEAENEIDKEAADDKITKKSASQQIGIDQIRKLDDFVYLSGHQQGDKIVVIYPAETMNTASANALLKKLEEPPQGVLFILVTHQPQRLLPTIRSRCQQIAMPVPDWETAVAWLRQHSICDPEIALAAAGYAPLAALRLAQNEQAIQFSRFVQQIAHPARLNPLSLADSLQQISLPAVVDWLQKWCYDLVSYRTTGRVRYCLNDVSAIEALSAQLDLIECIRFARLLNGKQRLSRHPLNPRLFLEEMFIAYAAMVRKR